MKTKISLVLLGLGLAAGSAYAGAVAAPLPVSNDINVTAPDQTGMWSFGAMAVLMQPTNKDFTYAGEANTNDVFASDQYVAVDHYSVDPGYKWWFAADISYAFPGNGRDVTLAYEGLHGTDTDHTSTDHLGRAGPNNSDFGVLYSSFSGFDYLTAEGKIDTNYDAGDLTFGQKLDVGSRIRLHPFVGLRYAHINTNDTGYYTGGEGNNAAGVPVLESENSELDNTFNGIGPRFGSDAQINLGQGFSIRGRLGLSALIGSHSIDNRIVVTDYDPSTLVQTGFLDANIADQSETRVIPEIDGRLGLNYTYMFDSSTALGFELGWQATNYFNVIADQPALNDIPIAQATSPSTHYDDMSNFGVQGPYARIQLDVA